MAPLSSCANADVAAAKAVASPSTTTTSPRSLPSSPPSSTSASRESLLPGDTATTVRATTSANDSAPIAVARPAPAITSGTAARASCRANARAWLNPSPYRKRRNEAASR